MNGYENLVSRSQAKRLLARVDRFKEVILDFADVHSIGQAFADEIFRVFSSQHPDVRIRVVNANDNILKMIRRVSGRNDEAASEQRTPKGVETMPHEEVQDEG